MKNILYTAPPTCARFMKSESFGRLIAGPVGSGKTTACLFELFRRACEQSPAADGFRYTRFAILRQTLKQLKDTVLKDITSWLEGIAEYKVSENTIYVEIGDVKSEWILIPLEDPEDRARLLSMQLTGAWMSEAIEMDCGVVPDIAGRCGRYPSAMMGGATWKGIIADTNMPTEGGDWHKFMDVDTPPDWQIFIQPGGLTPEAENLQWLNQSKITLAMPETDTRRLAEGRKYYERLARNQNEDWIRRYVDAQYGNDPSGSAVYAKSFNPKFHVVDELQPVSSHPLMVGQDFGRDPCSIICQVDHKGRLLVLEEVIAEDIGLEQHIARALRPALLQERYLGRPVAIIGDPAGKSKSSIYEETTFDVLKRMGFSAFPAPTNDIDPRVRAIDAWLMRQFDGGGAVQIDGKRCPILIKALQGGYRYAKTRAGIRRPLPEKNEFSHVIDAFQYVCLVAHGGMTELVARHLKRGVKTPRTKVNSAAWT
ncbi:MAG TPA: terminase [Xanthobacteraceae bacterium]|nr:terminase [Xanthobacteraceae bacterium]